MIDPQFQGELLNFFKNSKRLLSTVKLTQLVDGVSHETILPNSTYAPWRDEKDFLDIYERAKPNTLVDIYRLFELWSLVRQRRNMEGLILEIGVWKGGSGAIIASADNAATGSNILLVDTFEGVVKASSNDTRYINGEHNDTSLEEVQAFHKELGLFNISYKKGIFPDEVFLGEEEKDSGIKFCHIDVDTYQSARDCFEYIWPILKKGGCVVFDDYGFWGCEGVTRYCNEIKDEYGFFIHNLNGHAIFLKVPE
jgi:O-methyltransferase